MEIFWLVLIALGVLAVYILMIYLRMAPPHCKSRKADVVLRKFLLKVRGREADEGTAIAQNLRMRYQQLSPQVINYFEVPGCH